MFDPNRLNPVFRGLRGRGKITRAGVAAIWALVPAVAAGRSEPGAAGVATPYRYVLNENGAPIDA